MKADGDVKRRIWHLKSLEMRLGGDGDWHLRPYTHDGDAGIFAFA